MILFTSRIIEKAARVYHSPAVMEDKEMVITYRERNYIGDYKCIDRIKTINASSYFVPEGSSLYYFRVNEFSYKTISKEDIISMEE